MLASFLYHPRLHLIVGGIFLILFLTACSASDSGHYYRVKPADTLTRIAQRHQQSVHNLMRWNHLTTDHLKVGQRLRVVPPKWAHRETVKTNPKRYASSTHSSKTSKKTPKPLTPTLPLTWPASGQVSVGGQHLSPVGLHITNVQGTPIVAAAAGKVVYANNALRGYGNLVILQHDANFLTVYAHNHRLLVQLEQQVQQGQAIAEMGNSGSNRVELYFELRHNGKPIDPRSALPLR